MIDEPASEIRLEVFPFFIKKPIFSRRGRLPSRFYRSQFLNHQRMDINHGRNK